MIDAGHSFFIFTRAYQASNAHVCNNCSSFMGQHFLYIDGRKTISCGLDV